MDELERVAASYLLRPRGSQCFSSAAMDDEDDEDDEDDNRFADDGSVYIYREGDGSPSPSEQRAQRQEEDEVVHGDGDDGRGQEYGGSGVHDRGSPSGPMRVDGGVRKYGASDFGPWQDERCKQQGDGRRSSYGCNRGGSSGGHHRAMPPLRGEDRPTLSQRGGHGGRDNSGGGDAAAGLNSDAMRHTHADRRSPHRTTGQIATNPGDRKRSVRVGGVDELSGAPPDERGVNNGPNSGGVGSFDDSTIQPDRASCEEIPSERFAIPVPGACYSAKISRGLQGRPEHNRSTARVGGQVGDSAVEPSAKARQTATRLRNMILDRQASANRSIREVFRHFDRRRCGYVNVAEMRDAMADLRISLSPEEAKVSLAPSEPLAKTFYGEDEPEVKKNLQR